MPYIKATSHDVTKNLIGRPNVLVNRIVEARLQGKGIDMITNSYLYDALDTLTKAKPTWRFTFTNGDLMGNYYVLHEAHISEDGEALGSIDIEYKGRECKIRVVNKRIDAKRERGSGYHTTDPARAALAIRKHFYRLGSDERVTAAIDKANSVVHREANDKLFALNDARNHLFKRADEFAQDNLTQYIAAYPFLQQHQPVYQNAKEQFDVVKLMKESFDTGNYALVVLDGDLYIVRARTAEDGSFRTQTLTDLQLSEDIRMKLGMLKLVQDRQMVSDIGCRVDSTTFVLLQGANK